MTSYREYRQKQLEEELREFETLKEKERVAFETFKEQVFMGSGEWSKQQCLKAHAQLDKALSLISGLQQPNMSTDPPEEEGARDPLEQELRDVVVSLLTGLLGKDFALTIGEDK